MLKTRGISSTKLQDSLIIAGLSVWALAIRLAALTMPQRIVWGDEPFYLWLGRNWLTGQGYSFTGYSDVHHTPMYPFLTGVFYLLTHDMELASNLCYLLFGALLVIPIYLLAREMYGRPVGIISAVIVAVYPAISTAPLLWGTLTEPPYYFFIYSGLLMVLLAMRYERLWAFLAAGLLFGMAYLTRPEAVAYVALGAGVVALVRLFEKRLFQRDTWKGLLCLALGFLLFFGPYVYYVYRNTGSWMVSEKAGVTFVTCIGLSQSNTVAFDQATWGLDSTGTEVFFFSRESYHVSMIDVIRAYPAEFFQLVARNIRRFISSVLTLALFGYYLLPLLGVAFFRSAWDKRRMKGELLLVASLAPVLVFLLFFIQDRYIATLLPTVVIWLGLGVYGLGVWLTETVQNLLAGTQPSGASAAAERAVYPLSGGGRELSPVWRTAMTVIPTVLLLVYLAGLQPRIIQQYASSGSFRAEHKTLGLYLKDNIPADSVIMSRYPAIAFYAGTRWEPTPNAPIAQVLNYARANGVDYFVIDEIETLELRPQFAPLVRADSPPPELRLIRVDDSPSGKLVVYKLR